MRLTNRFVPRTRRISTLQRWASKLAHYKNVRTTNSLLPFTRTKLDALSKSSGPNARKTALFPDSSMGI